MGRHARLAPLGRHVQAGVELSVAVVVPWRGGCPHREAAWTWLRARWERTHLGWEVVEGTCPDGPWVKALAIADGLARTSADLIVLADSDVWCDDVKAAVDVVATRGGWAVPHFRVYRLTEQATREVLAGGPFGGRLARPWYVGFCGGGITVIERGLLDRVPVDPRFEGWGQEDQAAGYAWRTLGGEPWRPKGNADLWHLWHPPQPKMSRLYGSAQSRRLWRRYQQALRKPDAMAALISESHEVSNA